MVKAWWLLTMLVVVVPAQGFLGPTTKPWPVLTTPCQHKRATTMVQGERRDGDGMDRRSLLTTLTGLGMASVLGSMGSQRADAIGALPELEGEELFAQHLVLNVPDIEEAVKFYTMGLGMQVVRSRLVNGLNSTFVAYGPETLTVPPTFYPGVSAFKEYGAHFALELNEAPKTEQGDFPILDPGTGVEYLQIAVPTLRISKVRDGGGIIEYAYGWLRVRSPWGLLHQVIVGDRRDPMMFLALRVADQAKSLDYYTNTLGMSEQPYPLSRLPGSQFEPTQPAGTKYLSYDPDGFGLLLVPSIKKDGPVKVGTVVDKLAIVGTGVLDKAKDLGQVKFAGAAPGIGTRVAVTSDPDGYGVVLVEYQDFEKELK